MSHPVFKKKLLASCVAAACSMSMSMVAQAQDGVDEEVVVFGIRGSLEQSADIKRESVGVVDAITAEDIGKFPDTNLAESLQRISGVSIDRRNGEGFQVTVRGFGPQFNLVTLNGRSLPTSDISIGKSSGANVNPNRSFDMSNLGADVVSGVEVYKTGRADISSGGIGATVNLKTRRPLDTEGFTATFGAKALNDTTTRIGDDITPEYSVFASWSDDMFGASVAYMNQERNSANSGVFTNAWNDVSGPWVSADQIQSIPYVAGFVDVDGDGVQNDPDDEPRQRIDGTLAPDIGVGDVNLINEPQVGQQANLVPGIRYYHEDVERERENSMITLQARPMDNLTATLDYTKAEQHIFLNGAELSFWFGGGTFPATDVQFDGNSQVATPVYFWSEEPTGVVRDIGDTQNQGDVTNELESTGLNLEFVASDRLTLSLDAHSSESSSLPGDGIIGTYFNIATGAQGNWAQGYDNSGDLPLLLGVWADDNRGDPEVEPDPDNQLPSNPGAGVVTSTGNVPGEFDVGDLSGTVRQAWYARAWSEVDQTRVDGQFEFSDELSIDFGVSTLSMEATQKQSFLQETMNGNWGANTPGDVPPEMMEELNYASLFDGYRTTLTPEGQQFFDNAGLDLAGGNSGASAEVFTRGFIAKDVAALGRVLSEAAGLPWAPNPDDTTNRTIEEDINSFYVQGTYDMEVGGMPLEIFAGVRYEDTDVTSRSQVANTNIVWQGDNDLITQAAGPGASAPVQVADASYDHTLPSLALSLSITEDVIGRFAYSKTIARPGYNNQLFGIGQVGTPQGGPTAMGAAPGTASTGRPDLQPLESNNYDLSVEWYYDEGSYVSLGYFLKDVPNFIGNEVVTQEVLNTDGTPATRDPTNGPRVQAAIAQLAAGGIPLTQGNLFQMVASLSDEGVGCTTNFNTDAGENETNSAHCGADFNDPGFDYDDPDGWEDNVDISAIESGPDADPAYIARVNTPVDNQSAELDGWELAVQHFFGDTGFGVQANYTVVNGDIGYDVTSDPTTSQFALTGLSDSANLVLIYENLGWSARLAYNWRDAFLVNPTANANEPQFTDEYSQIDLNVGYDITDNLAVSFEGINLTGEDSRDYARTERQLLRLTIQDVRYALGVRYTFD